MAKAHLAFAVFALVILASLPMLARGNAVTVRLDISGATLEKPIRVTDRNILDLSNVYAGTFLGASALGVDPAWPRYVVSFVAESRTAFPALAPTGIQKNYLAHYALNRQTGEGFLYLPGRGEDGYRGNIGLIIRDDQDGRWHRASQTWADLLNPLLP